MTSLFFPILFAACRVVKDPYRRYGPSAGVFAAICAFPDRFSRPRRVPHPHPGPRRNLSTAHRANRPFRQIQRPTTRIGQCRQIQRLAK